MHKIEAQGGEAATFPPFFIGATAGCAIFQPKLVDEEGKLCYGRPIFRKAEYTMRLAERIMTLRMARGLSQEELARQLGVSRQSVSKWETGASTPELEKLTALADFFQITLDELVRGAAVPAPEAPAESAPAPAAGIQGRQIAGAVLLILGGICAILALVLHPLLFFPAGVLVLYGTFCLTVARHTGLVLAWITFLPLAVGGPRLTSMFFGYGTANVLTALIWLGFLVTLVRTFRLRCRARKD